MINFIFGECRNGTVLRDIHFFVPAVIRSIFAGPLRFSLNEIVLRSAGASCRGMGIGVSWSINIPLRAGTFNGV